MESDRPIRRAIRFGAFEVDLHAGELRKQGVKIKLQDQPLRILEMLLAHPGQLVTREELRSRLWPSDTFVDFDHGLNKAINKLREALGDSAENPQFVETIPRRGYRFTGGLGAETAPITIRSLLILPLENLSKDPEQGYFADGLTEALTTTLAKISALRVLSRTTAAHYKQLQKTLPQIAEELGVDWVVEGAVLRSKGRVRITAQLLHAPTDTHLWAESYDRDMRDILTLQAEVAGAIAMQIQVKVTPHEQTQLAHAPAVDPDAYEAYLRGRYLWHQRTPGAMQKSLQSFEHAIALDPRFAAAHAGLSDCVGWLGWFGFAAPGEGCERAKVLALKALEIDPNLAEAHASLAWAVQYFDYDFVTAEREFRRAIELDPRSTVAHSRLGMTLGFAGRFDESIAESKYSVGLDPLSVVAGTILCWNCWVARRFDQQIAQAKKALELHPDVPQCHYGLGAAYLETANFDGAIAEFEAAVESSRRTPMYLALLAEAHAAVGHRNDAEAILAELLGLSQQQYVTPYMVGRIHAALGHKDEAFRWLETAFEQRAALMVLLKRDPRLDSLQSDPRFAALVRRINYPS